MLAAYAWPARDVPATGVPLAKVSASFVCRDCGARSAGPLGRCGRCGAWGTVEAASAPAPSSGSPSRAVRHTLLAEVDDLALARLPTGIPEVDRVLGGGWVSGSAVLIAGEPGIGKSTLLLQLADESARAGHATLYVAGEESPGQVKLRAGRLGVRAPLTLTRETDARVLAEYIRQEAPRLAIVDSAQTLTVDDDGTAGSVSQVRDATAMLTQAAKASGTTLVLIGHVTKQGTVAGPKVIEHIVDATFALESAAGFRILRGMKNRFGPAGEVGVFEMRATGLHAVDNPSEAFLAERLTGVPGSVVAVVMEGQRAILLEVQALASKSPFTSPRRVVQGLDARRVDVVLAVLERRLDLPLAGLDVYVNVAGGLRVTDQGADLAVAVAVVSAVTNRASPGATALVGEVGLAGEIRAVKELERRGREAERSGYTTLIGPRPRGGVVGGGYREAVDLRAALDLVWRRS
jgi:DNA repair protein RadA/Sms